MHDAGVSAKTAKGYLKIFEEQVDQLQSKVWSASKPEKYFDWQLAFV